MKKTKKTAYLVKSYTLGLLSILTMVGCGPTYKATRVHVPHQTAQGQLQIEAKIPDDVTSDQYDTHIDASYTLTENVVLSSGLLVSSYRSNGDDEANQYNEDYSGLHVGAGYNTRLNDWIRVSSLAGLSLQSWSYENTEPATDIDSLELDEFTKFDSTIISPFAQTSLIFGGRRTNVSLSPESMHQGLILTMCLQRRLSTPANRTPSTRSLNSTHSAASFKPMLGCSITGHSLDNLSDATIPDSLTRPASGLNLQRCTSVLVT